MKFNRIVVMMMLVGWNTSIWADVDVKGRVVDQQTGKPVVGATIRVDHNMTGGTTNVRGEFELKGLPDGKQTLRVTHVNYEPRHYTVEQSTEGLTIRLVPTTNNLSQVVVTGTGTHRRAADSPVPVSVITAQDINKVNASNLEEVLTKLTSNFSFSTSAMGTEMVMGGLNSDYILVLVNGRRILGDDALMRIDVNNIKRIEILSHSAATLYGSDAIGGVINVITTEGRGNLEVGSTTHIRDNGRVAETASLDFRAGKLSSSTSYNYTHSDGWQLSPYAESVNKKTGEVTLSPTTRQAFTGFRSHNASQSFTLHATSKLDVQLHGRYFNYLTDRNVTDYKYNLLHESYTYGAGVKYIVNEKTFLSADFQSDNFTSSYDYMAESGEFKPGDRQRRKEEHFYNGNVKGVVKLAESNKLTAGMEYLDERLNSETDNIEGRSQYTVALYAQDEWSLSRNFQLVAGLRYVYNEVFEDHFTPNLSFMYKEGGFRGRITYATGFRTPTLSEVYATDVAKTTNRLTIGNLELRPEKSKNFSFNVEYMHKYFSVSATAFVNNVTDMINYRTLSAEEAAAYPEYDEVRQRDNIDKARIKGVTLGLGLTPGGGFSLNGGYTLTDPKNLITDGRLDKTVKHAGFVRGEWTKRWGWYRLGVNVAGRGQSSRYSETYDYNSPGFMTWDLNTNHDFTLKDFILNAGIGIDNLLDKVDDRPYNTSKPYASVDPGRTFYAKIAIRFKK